MKKTNQAPSSKPAGLRKYLISIAVVLLLCAGYPLWNNGNGDVNNTAWSYSDRQDESTASYTFRKESYLEEHFEKHGAEFDYATKEEYLEGANRVIASEDALHKTEAEDGDHIYYLEATNEIVFVSADGYIRTYFRPRDGIAYYDRQ